MKRVLLAIVALLAICGSARAQEGRYETIEFNSAGQFLAGVNIAVCSTLATTAASVTNNIATLTMASNPQTAGFLVGFSLTVSGFTGADTYFNTTATIVAVSSTTISFNLVHANASASSNGAVYMTGNSTQACAPLAPLFTDNTGTSSSPNPFVSDGLGNVGLWVAAGPYYLQTYGPTVTTSIRLIGVGCVPGSSVGTCGIQASQNIAFTGTDTACNLNNAFYAGTSCYPTIQSAITAANPGSINCSFTTTCGMVVIPARYAGTDTYNNQGLNVLVIDQRSNIFNAPSMNVPTFITSIDSDGTYPAGRDINIFPGGPAGLFFRRSTVDTTTTASLSVGANTGVLVGTVNNHNVDLGNVQTGTLLTLFSIGTVSSPQKIFIGRQTANNEQLTYNATAGCPSAGTWNIVDATHLCLNTTKTHAGTTDIEEPPDPVRFDFTDLQIRSYQARPSQDATTCLPLFWNDTNGINLMTFPSDTTCAAPRNQPAFNSGFNIYVGGGVFSASPVSTTWEAFSLGGPNFSMTNIDQGGTPRGFVGPFYGGTSNNGSFGNYRMQNQTFVTQRNAANTDDSCFALNASDQWFFRIACNSGPTFTATIPSATGTVLLTGNGATPIQTKHGVAGCATAAVAGSTCTTTVTWNTTFADQNYTPVCGGELVTSGVPVNGGLTAKANGSITFQTVAGTAAAAQYTGIDCTAVHD